MEFMHRMRARRSLRYLVEWDLQRRGICFLQGDQSIANQAGAATRSDLNNELQALVSNSSGSSAPSTTYAYQFWADTTNGVLKQRNAANSAWIVRAPLAESFLVSRSSNTILAVGDYGKTIVGTGTWTQTLTAAATLADGWWVEFRNDGTGIITIDPNGSETIDGLTTINLYPGEGCVIGCSGSAFKTMGRGTGLVRIQTQIASSSAQIDFDIGFTSDFDEYVITLTNAIPATDGASISARFSEDAGATFKAGATDYVYGFAIGNVSGGANSGSSGDGGILVSGGMSNSATAGGCNGEIKIFGTSGASSNKHLTCLTSSPAQTTFAENIFSCAGRMKLDANAINAIRLLASSGNIASGTFTLYGVRKQ
jgi:hypothetical protein